MAEDYADPHHPTIRNLSSVYPYVFTALLTFNNIFYKNFDEAGENMYFY
jgi:hypothetical protein